MKEFSELQIDAIIKLKFGGLVERADYPSYVSNAKLAKLFKPSGSTSRRLYLR